MDLAELVSAVDPTDATEMVGAILHHVHLPKLDQAGVLQYDPDQKRVRLVERRGGVAEWT
jgi:hypothetical protein